CAGSESACPRRRHRLFRACRQYQGREAVGRREGAVAVRPCDLQRAASRDPRRADQHLDIDSRAALIEAINDFPGAVILVSHDRYLLEACADRLWLVQSGTVKPFDGDLDDYRRRVLSDSETDAEPAAKSEPRTAPADTRRAAAEKRASTAPLRKRVTKAETEL